MLLFLLAGLAALVTAIAMVLNANPVRAALCLVLNLFSVAALYLLLNAYFLSTVQVIVYAGAIMVLFLFVIMLLNLGTPDRTPDRVKWQTPVSVLVGLLLAGTLSSAIFRSVTITAPGPEPMVGAEPVGTPIGIGKTLYNPSLPWLFPFEIASILLLVAVVGSVVLARRASGEEVSKA